MTKHIFHICQQISIKTFILFAGISILMIIASCEKQDNDDYIYNNQNYNQSNENVIYYNGTIVSADSLKPIPHLRVVLHINSTDSISRHTDDNGNYYFVNYYSEFGSYRISVSDNDSSNKYAANTFVNKDTIISITRKDIIAGEKIVNFKLKKN